VTIPAFIAADVVDDSRDVKDGCAVVAPAVVVILSDIK